MPENHALLSLLVITMLSALVPLLAARLKRFHVPVVILEILAGVLIGKSGLDIVTPGPILDFLSEFGFVILMFISGLEMDLGSFSFSDRGNGKASFWKTPPFLTLAGFILTLGLAFSIAWGLTKGGLVQQPLIIGLILSTTSLGIVVPILKERGIAPTRYGQTILLSALLADFLTLVFLSLSLGIATQGIAVQLTVFLILLVAFAATLVMGVRIRKIKGLGKLIQGLTTATVQIRTRFSIALMVAWVALAQSLGTEVILGAFLAGVVMSVLAGQDKTMLQEKLDTIGFGFFIPLFFISVGSEFDLRVFLGSHQALALLPLLVAAAYTVKVLPSLVFRVAFSFRESMAAGFLLSSRLSLIIAASSLAFKLGLISEAVNANILLLAMVTCMLSPLLFNRIAPRAEEIHRQGYVVVGFNQHTALLIERLLREGERVSVLQAVGDPCHEPYCQGAKVRMGDPLDARLLESLGAETAAGLVTALNDPRADVAVCRLARERFRIPVVVSRADDHGQMKELADLGVKAVQPSLATALALEGALRYPAAFDMISELSDGTELGEAAVRDSRYQDKPLGEVRLPGNALIMGIRRGGDVIVPHGSTTLAVGDILMLVGSPEAIRETRMLMNAP
ncbi:MAG TPA: monovalent cation:proton antiporter family protein [Syntrophales bacterium]|nr:monovalent cation:proton antiporter family protein [Candidatus Omnitrophota bacterium]MDX9820323.1 monovalent cation:proton antiporter family protein [Syntrophales bacterium]HPJ97054.1 monovalent cation:proton antiporter family protein [Syntrophales bacterium]